MNLDELAAAARSGRDELGQLYELMYPRVYNYVRYRCEDQGTTEDLVSQVFERMVAALHTYDPGRCPFEAWIFAIARNTVNSHHRRRALRQFLPWEWFHAAAAPGPSPEESALLRESETRLLAALQLLKPQWRDLLGLRYGSGLSNTQIAALTGLSEGNVAVILHRAVEALRLIVKPGPDDEEQSVCQAEAEQAKEG